MTIAENITRINSELPPQTKLVAVSKFHPASQILEAYGAGQRLFAESRPQELASKVDALPGDIEWHFIGHLQTNKLKMVLPYAALVQSVDTRHLLEEINKWGKANSKVIPVLLELHIGAEETKQGFFEEEVLEILFSKDSFPHIEFRGLMGMASHTDDDELVSGDFARIRDFYDYLRDLFPEIGTFDTLSIGMSDDYRIALKYGPTLVRIGTAIFGERG